MVKIQFIRHAESEVNAIRQKYMEKFELSLAEKNLFSVYKTINSDILVDPPITQKGKIQCQISNIKNKQKLSKVILIK